MALLGLWSEHRGRDIENEKRFVRDQLSVSPSGANIRFRSFLQRISSYGMDATLGQPVSGNLLASIAHLGNAERGMLLPGPEVDPEEFILDNTIRTESERKHSIVRFLDIEGLLHCSVRHNMKQV